MLELLIIFIAGGLCGILSWIVPLPGNKYGLLESNKSILQDVFVGLFGCASGSLLGLFGPSIFLFGSESHSYEDVMFPVLFFTPFLGVTFTVFSIRIKRIIL